jgi:phosphatidylinositol alpha-1,6-mannosyltransferase
VSPERRSDGPPVRATRATLRIITIGHSYVVTRNRELARALGLAGAGRWDVTVVSPQRFPGDFGPLELQSQDDHAIRVEGVPVRFARKIHFMRYGGALRKLLKERWDVVHAWEEPYIAASAQIARAAPKSSRLVYATFQNIAKRYPPPFRMIERISMSRADGWIAFGKTVEQALQTSSLYARTPHRVIPFGVNVEQFRPDAAMRRATRELLGWPANDEMTVLGFLGRFVQQKGVRLLMQRLDAQGGQWRALFVGGGPLHDEMRAWAERYTDRVRIVTGVPHSGVPAYLNAMDVLCAPSVSTERWKEQLGRMLIEAFACGVPVIASDSGEIPHVVGNAGLIVAEHDEGAWHSALEAILADRSLRAELAGTAHARAETHFAWPVVARQHLDFFQELIEAAPRAR